MGFIYGFLLAFFISPLSDATMAHQQVLGGVNVPQGEHLNVVALTVTGNGIYCTGTLIKDNIILTAAHCLDQPMEYYRIYVGSGKRMIFFNEDRNFKGQHEVKSIHPYPKYFGDDGEIPPIDDELNRFDVGIIVLKKPILNIKPMNALISKQLVAPLIDEESNTTIIGFGFQEPYFSVDDIPFGEKKRIERQIIKYENPYIYVDGHIIDTCQIDSGGPLMIETNGEFSVIGVVSTKVDGDCGAPPASLYAPLFEVEEWISQFLI